MSKDIRQYLHYYIGQPYRYRYIDWDFHQWTVWTKLTLDRLKALDDLSIDGIELALRKLEDMTEEELIGLLQSMVPADMEDKPDEEDYDLELFHNDGGNLVDGDVAVGANYSCSCYEGQIAIRYDGSIDLFDEDNSRQGMSQAPLAFHYLLSKGFDLFGLIPAGLAIDSATLTNK